MEDAELAFASLQPAPGERFVTLRRQLGIESFGINLLTLEPGQRGRIHAHEHQEEAYIVLEGELSLHVDGGKVHVLGPGQVVRVGPALRRQLVNAGGQKLVLRALGSSGEHAGRDGRAWAAWDETGPGRSPQEVPLPEDLPT
jgi:uncharacterized cupin superfamily protein